MKQLLKKLATEESGQDLIEYALVAALVGLGAVASITALKNTISNTFNAIGGAMSPCRRLKPDRAYVSVRR